jgi:hypothetical protein
LRIVYPRGFFCQLLLVSLGIPCSTKRRFEGNTLARLHGFVCVLILGNLLHTRCLLRGVLARLSLSKGHERRKNRYLKMLEDTTLIISSASGSSSTAHRIPPPALAKSAAEPAEGFPGNDVCVHLDGEFP